MAKFIQSVIQAIFQSFNTLFNKGFESVEIHWEKVAMMVPSSGSQENYAWLGNFPHLREWIGERAIKKLMKKSYSIINKSFEATVSVKRTEIEDDAYGVYSPVFQSMGESAALWPDEMIFNLLPNGFEELCYDEKPFFAEDHPVGDRTKPKKVSNLSEAKLTLESYKAARAAMMSFKSDEGKALGIIGNLLVVPPALEDMGRRILKSEFIEMDGVTQTNPYKDTAELLVVPQLAGHDSKWYLLCTSKAIKPLIYQNREEPSFQALDANSEHAFKTDELVYGVKARGNVGFSFWQLGYGSKGTN